MYICIYMCICMCKGTDPGTCMCYACAQAGACSSAWARAWACAPARAYAYVHVHVRVDRPPHDAGPARRRPRQRAHRLQPRGTAFRLQLLAHQARARRCSRRGRRGGGLARGSEITTYYSLLITYYSYTTYYSLLATRYALLLLLTTHSMGSCPPRARV